MFCTKGEEVFYGGFDIESKIYVRRFGGFDEELLPLSDVTMCKLRKVTSFFFFFFLFKIDMMYFILKLYIQNNSYLVHVFKN